MRRLGLLRHLLLGVWAWCAWAQAAAARPRETITLRWRATDACPRPPGFKAQLAARLGAQLARARAIEIDIDVREHDDGYELTLEAQSGGERVTRAVRLASCAEVQRAAAVLVETAIVFDEVERHASSTDATRAVSLRIGTMADLQALPEPALGPVLGIALEARRRLQLWLDARYLFARHTEAGDAGTRAEIDLLAAGFGSSYLWRRGRLAFGPLLELEFGALRGEVVGSRGAGKRAAPWLSVWTGPMVGYAVGPALFALSMQLGVPLLRPGFALPDETSTHRTGPVGVRVQLGAMVALHAKKMGRSGQ